MFFSLVFKTAKELMSKGDWLQCTVHLHGNFHPGVINWISLTLSNAYNKYGIFISVWKWGHCDTQWQNQVWNETFDLQPTWPAFAKGGDPQHSAPSPGCHWLQRGAGPNTDETVAPPLSLADCDSAGTVGKAANLLNQSGQMRNNSFCCPCSVLTLHTHMLEPQWRSNRVSSPGMMVEDALGAGLGL